MLQELDADVVMVNNYKRVFRGIPIADIMAGIMHLARETMEQSGRTGNVRIP